MVYVYACFARVRHRDALRGSAYKRPAHEYALHTGSPYIQVHLTRKALNPQRIRAHKLAF